MAEKTFFELFAEEGPEVSKAVGNLYESLKNTGGLDEKTFELVFMALKVATRSTHAASVHAGFAKKAGATREEVRGAVLLTIMTGGMDGADSCLAAVLDAYDKA